MGKHAHVQAPWPQVQDWCLHQWGPPEEGEWMGFGDNRSSEIWVAHVHMHEILVLTWC